MMMVRVGLATPSSSLLLLLFCGILLFWFDSSWIPWTGADNSDVAFPNGRKVKNNHNLDEGRENDDINEEDINVSSSPVDVVGADPSSSSYISFSDGWWDGFWSVFSYRPPTGAVATVVLIRLVWTGRIFTVHGGVGGAGVGVGRAAGPAGGGGRGGPPGGPNGILGIDDIIGMMLGNNNNNGDHSSNMLLGASNSKDMKTKTIMGVVGPASMTSYNNDASLSLSAATTASVTVTSPNTSTNASTSSVTTISNPSITSSGSTRKERRKRQKRERRDGRAWFLDEDDVVYDTLGGVDHVRARLCRAALLVDDEQHVGGGGDDVVVKDVNIGHGDGTIKTAFNASNSTSPSTLTTRDHGQHDRQSSRNRHEITALEGLEAAVSRPAGSRFDLIQEIIPSLAILLATTTATQMDEFRRDHPDRWYLVDMATEIIHVRAIDAMLRICRDRILHATHRMARTKEYWEDVVAATTTTIGYQGSGRRRRLGLRRRRRRSAAAAAGSRASWWPASLWPTSLRPMNDLTNKKIEADRLRLIHARAAYSDEIQRLGQVLQMLIDRPKDMDETYLLDALHRSSSSSSSLASPTGSSDTRRRGGGRRGRRRHRRRSRYAFLWNSEGKMFSIKSFDSVSSTTISSRSATRSLVRSHKQYDYPHPHHHDEWLQDAREWTRNSRRVIFDVIDAALLASDDTKGYVRSEFDLHGQRWCHHSQQGQQRQHKYPTHDEKRRGRRGTLAEEGSSGGDNGTVNDDTSLVFQDDWKVVLRYAEAMSTWRRSGEGRSVRLLPDAAATMLAHQLRRIDVFGIPSSLLWVLLAHCVHLWIEPNWPWFRRETVQLANLVREVAHTRFWIPLRGILDDITNKSPGMMSSFGIGLDVEERTLDLMLRDLGYGDGTIVTRHEALRIATEKYESDLHDGLFSTVVSGRLIRLLLVQVQQLKVGLLSTLDTIDVLYMGNRINLQVLAAIPAVIIVTYGTRILWRILYNIRAKDLRPVESVLKYEMPTYLANMESIIIALATTGSEQQQQESQSRGSFSGASSRRRKRNRNRSPFDRAQLGEFVLNMHRYLLLLDYTSPPLSTWYCDQVHAQMLKCFGYRKRLPRRRSHGSDSPVEEGSRRHDHDSYDEIDDDAYMPMTKDGLLSWLSNIKQKHDDLMKQL